MAKTKLTAEEKDIRELKQKRVRYELSFVLLNAIHKFKSKEEPDCDLTEKDVDAVLSQLLCRRMEQRL